MNHGNSRIGRRQLIAAAGLTGAGAMPFAQNAYAADYPERDVIFMIPYAPGGSYDNYVRIIGPAMSTAFGGKISVVPDNVDGAGGARAGNVLSRARPDGYSISVLNAVGLLVLKQKGKQYGFDLTDLTWVGNLGRDNYALVVAADSKIKTMADLRALSAKQPIKFTSSGPESTSYAATMIGSQMLGLRTQVIPGYRSTNECLIAVMRGDGDATVLTLPAVAGMLENKLVRVLASFEKTSSIPGADDATTLGQPDLANIIEVRPVAGPPRLPAPIANSLSSALTKAMADPKVIAWSKKIGATLDPMSPEETTALIKTQTAFVARWAKYL
jgi:tripartite-type tricarboxylate transporter receptor subunit TctC